MFLVSSARISYFEALLLSSGGS